MRSSFTGITFTPGLGVSVWSRGRRIGPPEHHERLKELAREGR